MNFKQKGMAPKKYLTVIKINEVEDRGKLYLVTAEDGEKYSKFKADDNLDRNLVPGNNMSVFVTEAHKGNRIYKNIYPDITKPGPIEEEDL